MTTFQFDAIGTHWQIDIDKELSLDEEALLRTKVMERIGGFDKAYSRFRDDSLVMEMARKAGEYTLPSDAGLMIDLYKKMYEVTRGLVTPLIGKTLEEAGYDATYSLQQKELTHVLSWEEVLDWNNTTLTLKQPALLDFGAGGKGYLVDIISDLLEKEGILSYCVDAGGDMRTRSSKSESLKVGLEHPEDTTSVIGTVEILNQSLCGSAGNRRAWGDFHHVIDPKKLSSPRDILSVWVVAETTLLADLLTTALFFVSPEVLAKHFTFGYLILYPNYTIKKSSDFNTELFT